MHNKTLYLALAAFLLLSNIDAKKPRRIKKPKNEDEETTPQPNVVTYSTFGFNDVGSYDGFVPSSPDYVNYLSSSNQEAGTRLYAPAFPTAAESTGYGHNFGSQTRDGNFDAEEDNVPQSSILQYQQSSSNYFNNPNYDSSPGQSQKGGQEEILYGQNSSPTYGSKLSSKNNKYKSYNNSEFNAYSSGPSSTGEEKYVSYHDTHTNHESKGTTTGESGNNYNHGYSNYAPTYPTSVEDVVKPSSTSPPHTVQYQKVVDFTNMKQFYPTAVETKYPVGTVTPTNGYNSVTNIHIDNDHTRNYGHQKNKHEGSSLSIKDNQKESQANAKDDEDDNDKQTSSSHSYTSFDFSNSSPGYSNTKKSKDDIPNLDLKDKFRYKQWAPSTNNDLTSWKSNLKGYDYSTDFSKASFKLDIGKPKKHVFNSNIDEVVPASSNIVDTNSYQFPENDFSTFKKFPNVKNNYEGDYSGLQLFKPAEKYKSEDYLNQFKNLYSSPSLSNNQWGGMFKQGNYYPFKQQNRKPYLNENVNDDIVNIQPKRPSKYSFGKYSEVKPTDWSSFSKYKQFKGRPVSDWNKEISGTRYKTEEDLLGLRIHDTSHPNYLPTYTPNDAVPEETDFRKLAEKWRQSYLKSKYKDLGFYDSESFASDTKPVHVPVPKPYPIEVPRPVIVPVPQPYPVKVPIPRPVAVPIYKELTIQIDKPVPYPVYKNVPYPVERPVPVPVEKQVHVPVIKPYPVAVPHIRPVFHHTRSKEEAEEEEEDDYMPRPSHEVRKRIPYSKKPRSTRNRPHRPTRMSYQESNSRRWPPRRPSTFSRDQKSQKRPSQHHYSSQKYHDFDEGTNGDFSDYLNYCKKTGNC